MLLILPEEHRPWFPCASAKESRSRMGREISLEAFGKQVVPEIDAVVNRDRAPFLRSQGGLTREPTPRPHQPRGPQGLTLPSETSSITFLSISGEFGWLGSGARGAEPAGAPPGCPHGV